MEKYLAIAGEGSPAFASARLTFSSAAAYSFSCMQHNAMLWRAAWEASSTDTHAL